jgi:hypothetical protein
MPDAFADMLTDDDGRAKSQAILALRSPAVNGIELCIVAMHDAEPLLLLDPDFGDDVSEVREMETPEMSDIRVQIANHYLEHISLARSLGPGSSLADYVLACEQNGMTPLNLNHSIIGEKP